jgi:selenide,water dikinase
VLGELTLSLDDRLLVGIGTRDDAGVFRAADGLGLVQTLDFFTPIVDNPADFGRIAAANALSDVYAMGGEPLTVMNIVCYPLQERGPQELVEILKGGAEKIAESGAVLVGGHSVQDAEPKYGLSVTGRVDPERITTNAGIQPGDAVVLTKALGTGIITTAAKFDNCPPEWLESAVQSMTTLNAAAAKAMRETGIGADAVTAATDVTGFGLLGHLHHAALASQVNLTLHSQNIPILHGAAELAASGTATGGQRSNEQYLQHAVEFAPSVPPEIRAVMFDPQTSGGLAISVNPAALARLLSNLTRHQVPIADVIGRAERAETTSGRIFVV